MAQEKSPAFQFYPKDWLSDEHVVLMTHTEKGIYMDLMAYCWLEGSLPDDAGKLAALVHLPPGRFARLWQNGPLRLCFRPAADGRLGHKRLDEERTKQATNQQRGTDRGLAGATARWRKHSLSNAQAIVEDAVPGMLSDGSSLSSSIASSDLSLTEREPPSKPVIRNLNGTTDEPGTEEERLSERARALIERYQALYPELRHGARLRLTVNSLAFQDACDLVRHWDDARLEKLARIVLTTDDAYISRTDRSFRIFAMKASWADDRLAEVEAQRKVAKT